MHIVLFDEPDVQSFLPLAFTRPVGALRCGIFTNAERWQSEGLEVSFRTTNRLQEVFPESKFDELIYANGRAIWDEGLRSLAMDLKPGEVLSHGEALLAYRCPRHLDDLKDMVITAEVVVEEAILLENVRDLFLKNGEVLALDFEEHVSGRSSAPLPSSNTLIGPSELLFIEEGSQIEASTLNTSTGPIYIGRKTVVMEGSLIRGGLALCEGSQVKMGAKIYGPTTFGPECRIGGEVSNSVFQGYSNKGHDGFLGNSVLGEWCNLGADTNTSNLKNNYGPVKVWDYGEKRLVDSGLIFCGLIMGDHSKCSINTQFNTGTTVGVSANIFSHGFPPKFIPSFSWGGAEGSQTYELDKSLDVASRVCARRKVEMNEADRTLMGRIFEDTADLRT